MSLANQPYAMRLSQLFMVCLTRVKQKIGAPGTILEGFAELLKLSFAVIPIGLSGILKPMI